MDELLKNHLLPSSSPIIELLFSPVLLLHWISRQKSIARALYPLQTFWDALLLWDSLKCIVKFSMILGKAEVNIEFFSSFSRIGIMRNRGVWTDFSICDCLIWKPGNR